MIESQSGVRILTNKKLELTTPKKRVLFSDKTVQTTNYKP